MIFAPVVLIPCLSCLPCFILKIGFYFVSNLYLSMVTFSKHALAAALVNWLEHNSHESSPNGPFLKFILLCTERGVTPWQYVYIQMQAMEKLMQMMTEEFFMNFPTWIGYRGWEKRSPGSDEHMFFRRWLTVGTSIFTLHQASATKPMYASACLLNGRSDHKKVDKNTHQFVKIHVCYLRNEYSYHQSTSKYFNFSMKQTYIMIITFWSWSNGRRK